MVKLQDNSFSNIIVRNLSDKTIYISVEENDSDLKPVQRNDVVNISTNYGSTGLNIYSDSSRNRKLWSGIVPAGVELKYDGELSMSDTTIPSASSDPSSSTSGFKNIGMIILGIIALLIILAIIYHLITRKSGKKMRKLEMEDF